MKAFYYYKTKTISMKGFFTTVLAILFLSLLLTSCDDNVEESNVDLNIQLNYDGLPLYTGLEVDYALGYQVFFTKYSFYLSDITLTSTEGEYLLSSVEFVDLLAGKTDAESAEGGTSLTYAKVPTREYTGLKMNIGVPTSVNATAPNTYDIESPLANTGEYWEGWSSYIFHKIEGRIDDPNGTEAFETALAIHIGSDAAFRSFSINTPISLDKENETIKMSIDLAKAFEVDGGTFDLLETPQVHHLGVLPKVLPILDATESAFEIQ